MTTGDQVSQVSPFGVEKRTSLAPALELRALKKSFGPVDIIQGVDLVVPQGERHAVIGPNGAGKSTLFNLISGLLVPTSGDVMLRGAVISGRPPHEINRMGLSRSFQVTNIFPRMSVFENVRCATFWNGGQKYSFWGGVGQSSRVRERTEEVLEQIGLQGRAQTMAGVLTYAEQRSLEIGITIAGGADVILLDEPTAGMSRHETEAAVELIRTISEGRTLIIVEHDMSVVFGLADRISVLVYGEIIETGAPGVIRASARVKEAYLGEEAHA